MELAKRVFFILIYGLLIGLLKFFLLWSTNLKSHAKIVFNFNPIQHSLPSFFSTSFFYILSILIFVLGAYVLYRLYSFIAEFGLEFLRYTIEQMIGVLLFTICMLPLLSSYFIYSYVGVYSSFEYSGIKGMPQVAEFSSLVFPKSDKLSIEKQIKYLEEQDEGEAEGDTHRFLFKETAVFNAYFPVNNDMHGWIVYINTLFWAIVEYCFLGMLYIGVPILLYDFYYQFNQKYEIVKK